MRRSEVLAEESILCLQKALNHLREIWELIGIPEDQRLQRTEVVKKHIKDLLDMMIAEEESLKERLTKSIAVCQKEPNTVQRTTILQLEKDLHTQVVLRRKQEKERKQELKILREQDQELCEILCMPHSETDSTSVPSLEELNQFRQHVATLRETKASRHEEFVNIKRQIILCMEELEHTPDTSFERDVVCEDEEAFCLSLENTATLQKLLRQLEVRKSQNEAVCEGLRAQIRELWDRLQIPAEEREAVATVMTGSKAKVRKALQLEVDRLEELKMQNMKKVIEAIRVEVAQHWDKCFYSQGQRRAFAACYSEDYTENLLQLHDAEIVRLRNYYEVHKELFEGVQKWEESWRLFLEFDIKYNKFSNFVLFFFFSKIILSILDREAQHAAVHGAAKIPIVPHPCQHSISLYKSSCSSISLPVLFSNTVLGALAGLVVLNSLNLCLSGKLLISPSNLNESCWVEFLGCSPFLDSKARKPDMGLKTFTTVGEFLW
ncbi:hypothetical protein FD755_008512 [Muntiacus reevesi]|uniref:Protein regulator of cytokinesis 1 n=1 Tax=Muntiacus reevesi TaxID=9886 RepID=A0A5J5MPR4_MUNRE|nr:hypothetical protein FD755_008512 [Muntiacus reevesi]